MLKKTTLLPHCPIRYGFDENSPPALSNVDAKEGNFLISFDHRLWMFHRTWHPPLGTKVHATLMIVHGTVDHSGAYAELAQQLALAGIAVFALDMRGWGLSDGESMYIDDMETFVADVDALYQHVHSLLRYKAIESRFLMGKSLGGTVTAFCVAKYPTHWTGILGLSGAYQLDAKLTPSSLVMVLLKGLARILPKLPFKSLFDEHLIVADEQALQAWRDDPLCCKDKFRLGYIVSIIDCLKKLPCTILPQINLPMLMMCGDADQVVTLSGHELMIEGNRHSDKQLKIYLNGYHNLLQEPAIKLRVMADIQEWILSHK
jgi:alpha-beta hydrolase superfamily lysophospholipase